MNRVFRVGEVILTAANPAIADARAPSYPAVVNHFAFHARTAYTICSMKKPDLSIPKKGTVQVPTAEVQSRGAPGWNMATRDHDVIRAWAARHGAEPATGEATPSGPATVNVNDGGVGIRFNFPGVGRFRPISWTEWLEHFDRNRLTFVYQEEVADRAYALWQSRGGDHGHDRQDWFDAEQQLRQISDGTAGRYWFVQHDPDPE